MDIRVVHPNRDQIDNLIAKNATLGAVKWQTQTITSVKAQVPSSELSGRKMLIIRNLDKIRTCRVGDTNITAKLGALLEPMSEMHIALSSGVSTDIYAIATGAELKVEVLEA